MDGAAGTRWSSRIVAAPRLAGRGARLAPARPRAERFFGLFGWKSAAGLALFGCGGIVYALLLRRVPLNLAQVFTSAQFAGVVAAASLALGEPISPARWLGIACIGLEIALVGLSANI